MSNETNPKLKLRGHHIGVFAESYFDEPIPHKPQSFYGGVDFEFTSREDDEFISLYGKKMKDFVDSLWNTLKTNSDIEIEIVEGLDTICMEDCPRRDTSCGAKEVYEDKFTLEQYGLEVGQIYTVEEIIKRIKKFAAEYCVRSPHSFFS